MNNSWWLFGHLLVIFIIQSDNENLISIIDFILFFQPLDF